MNVRLHKGRGKSAWRQKEKERNNIALCSRCKVNGNTVKLRETPKALDYQTALERDHHAVAGVMT
jgi:hypothetical protein